jgi:protease II
MDLKSDKPASRLTTGKDFLYRGDVYDGKVYITTNEDAPRYRVFVTEAGNFDREGWKEIIPQSDGVLQGRLCSEGNFLLNMRRTPRRS